MTCKQVYEIFKLMFPHYINDDLIYFPNGKNSIRIRGVDKLIFKNQDVVFTVDGRDRPVIWKLESVDSFIKNLKGEK